jgi:F-box-like
MLDMTLQNIIQLGATLNYHLEQERQIHSQIKSLEHALTQMKQQQVTVKAAISTIQQSIATMKETEQQLRHSLSPMRDLPDEILLHIFRIIVQGADSRRYHAASTWKLSTPEDRDSQVQLGGVCRRWRAIINDNSSLWTTVEVRLNRSSEETQNREHERVTYWKKAGNHSEQSLLVYGWKFDRRGFFEKLLGTESIKWKAIHIGPLQDEATGFFGNHYSKDVTIYRRRQQTARYFTPLMRQASVLVLYGPPPEWGTLPWIQLQSFTLKAYATLPGDQPPPLSFGHEELTALLFAATELTDLVLDFSVDGATLMEETSTSITHRNLTSFSLHLHHFVAGKGPFGVTLNAPSLQTLDFISLQCDASGGSNNFACYWDDPKTLSLPVMNGDDVLLAVELTKWLPNVQNLRVIGNNVDGLFTFFHSLLHHIPPHSLPLPLPKLNSLFVADTDLRGATLIELLESRLRHVRSNTADICAIIDIKMYNSPAVTVTHWNRVQQLLIEGAESRDMMIEDDVGISAGAR